MPKLTADEEHWDNPDNKCPCGQPMPLPEKEGKYCTCCGVRQPTMKYARDGHELADKFCHHCNEPINPSDKHCENCGEEIHSAGEDCPQCGATGQKGAACLECGYVLQPIWTE